MGQPSELYCILCRMITQSIREGLQDSQARWCPLELASRMAVHQPSNRLQGIHSGPLWAPAGLTYNHLLDHADDACRRVGSVTLGPVLCHHRHIELS